MNFANAFQSVWNRIPDNDRDLMVRYWIGRTVPSTPPHKDPLRVRQLIDELSSLEILPVIELTTNWVGHTTQAAKCDKGGHHIYFIKHDMASYPDFILEVIIAHEIAHTLHTAETTLLNIPHPHNVEAKADEITRNWGLGSIYEDRFVEWFDPLPLYPYKPI